MYAGRMRRAGPGRGAFPPAAPSLHRRAPGRAAAARAQGRKASDHSRHGAPARPARSSAAASPSAAPTCSRAAAASGRRSPRSKSPIWRPAGTPCHDAASGAFARVQAFPRQAAQDHAAVKDVSLTLRRANAWHRGRIAAPARSTLGRLMLGLHQPTAGRVRFEAVSTSTRSRRREAAPASAVTCSSIFQDPLRSLDPRLTVARHRRAAGHPPDRRRSRRRSRWRSCWRSSVSTAGRGEALSRTSSPAASASASASRGPSRWSPDLIDLPTSRSRPSTCRSSPRS